MVLFGLIRTGLYVALVGLSLFRAFAKLLTRLVQLVFTFILFVLCCVRINFTLNLFPGFHGTSFNLWLTCRNTNDIRTLHHIWKIPQSQNCFLRQLWLCYGVVWCTSPYLAHRTTESHCLSHVLRLCLFFIETLKLEFLRLYWHELIGLIILWLFWLGGAAAASVSSFFPYHPITRWLTIKLRRVFSTTSQPANDSKHVRSFQHY